MKNSCSSEKYEDVLMFSGGRDSSIAVARMLHANRVPLIITIVSNHLVGLGNVSERVKELEKRFSVSIPWLRIQQPFAPVAIQLKHFTCLPCQATYASVGMAACKHFNATSLMFGYTKYQNSWPEQTPEAEIALRLSLKKYGIKLELPVRDLESKEEAEAELSRWKLSTSSLEQKCIKQINNKELLAEDLKSEVNNWILVLEAQMALFDFKKFIKV